ncbi:hypothetical protein BKH42_08435 [Helicobacter sp. 13S00482-2]|nr:hypothetical protein BKH42_08435 [Helicobacter sp. 13S00482-2]
MTPIDLNHPKKASNKSLNLLIGFDIPLAMLSLRLSPIFLLKILIPLVISENSAPRLTVRSDFKPIVYPLLWFWC